MHVFLWDWGRKLEYLGKTHTGTEGTRQALVFCGLSVGGPQRGESSLWLFIHRDSAYETRNETVEIKPIPSHLLSPLKDESSSYFRNSPWIADHSEIGCGAGKKIKNNKFWAVRQKLDMESFLLVGSDVAGSTGSLKGPFNCQSGAIHDTKCSTTQHVLQRSLGRRGVYLAAISEGQGCWKTRWAHAEFCKSS